MNCRKVLCMENKKQLIIVPPLSEPFQKLNEVLIGIADDENIEISTIEDPKELNQVFGSSGQCLVAFSNAKKCATFLQENKFIIAKNHSKVILFTPKEIPAKTLVKFVKLGLTESIIESSAPKTLLYKVKLLLRSIKSTTQKEDKDHVVKSLLDTESTSGKAEDSTDKVQTEEAKVNYLADEKAKYKKNQEEVSINYDDNLKGKTSQAEAAIDTHWKSKRKTTNGHTEDEDGNQKVETDESSEIDMYLRGKKEKKAFALDDGDDNLYTKKKKANNEEQEPADLKNKNEPELEIALEAGKNESRPKYQEEEGDLSLKQTKETFDLEAGIETNKPKAILTEEEKKENLKKELEELDALFAEAKKRQASDALDLGGHLRGKILNNELAVEDLTTPEDQLEYDNSEIKKNEKSLTIDLISATEEKNKKQDNESDIESKNPHEGQVDKIDNNMLGENSSTDHISTYMTSEINKKNPNDELETDLPDLDPKQKTDKNSEAELDKKDRLKLVEDTDNSLEEKRENLNTEDESPYKENSKKKTSTLAIDEEDRESDKAEQAVGKDFQKQSLISEELGVDIDRKKSASDEVDPNFAFKKLDLVKLDLIDGNDGADDQRGKVDQIDSFYRGGKGIKSEHSWDNLGNKNRDINLQLEKTKRRDSGNAGQIESKDYGEVTIDYRKLKAEFDHLSKNGQSLGDDGISKTSSHKLLDSEDEGTFKVITIDDRGFDFGINIINLIYQKDSKPLDFYKAITEELINKYHAFPVFFTYKPSDKKHTEAFDCFTNFNDELVSAELKEWWINSKKQDDIMADYFEKTMSTWLCREIEDKSGNGGSFWEDIELPQWAENELTDKKVELIFPYYDGVDRMGVAIIFFPQGINPKIEKGLFTTLEMARTILLDNLQRKSIKEERVLTEEPTPEEKKSPLSLFKGLFNRNKAG
jgi:hypothetical protein